MPRREALTRTEKDTMKLKLDENGHVVVKDGFPVWVAEDGAEIAYNVPDLVNKISAVNAESAGRRKDIDALTSQLKAFDGIDPEKAKAALETVANLDAGKLIDAGKVDDLKMEIKKSYDGKISDLEKALADSKKDSADRLAAKEASIRTLLVKGIFDSSAFLKDKTVLPSDVAYASFGRHFEVKEENGELRVVATMNGQPIFSRSDPGTFAAPEEALEAIIDKYPMKDRILKAPDGGSGSHPNAAYAPGAKIIPKGDMSAFGANLEAIANDVNATLLGLGRKFYGMVGTPGTTPFSTVVDATNARKVLNRQLAPVNDRRIVLDPDAEAAALGLSGFADVSKSGFDWAMDQQVPSFEASVMTEGALTVNGANEAGAQVVSLAKATNAAGLKEGDILTIADDAQTYVVTEAVSLAVGNTAVKIYPGLARPTTGSEAVTVSGSHVMNLAFHRDAIAFATRPLMDSANGLGNLIQSAVDPVSGLSLRLEVSREHKRTRFSYDILYGADVVRRELGCRIAG